MRRDADGRFCLGLGLVGLGRAAADGVPARRAGPARCSRALRDETGESVQLFVREGDGRRCVVSLQSPHGLRWIVPEGAVLPLAVGSAGRVLAGESRPRGWVESVEEREPGVASVSAPVHDRGAVVAAVSVSGPVERLSRRPGRRFGPQVVARRGDIAALGPLQLGWPSGRRRDGASTDARHRLGRARCASWPAERDAVILAHNYQLPEIQEVAHHVGDSLGLSRVAAAAEASTIVFCGVHFMAETAKILSYDKTVLIPDERAGCSLAETITAEQLRAWKAEHPGAVVVSYVNTTAAVKAETDICCTSSNAVDVVASIPADTAVLFCPDQFLGAHVQRQLRPREHAHLARRVPRPRRHQRRRPQGPGGRGPDAELFIHPECGCATSALYLVGAGVVPETRTKILSTSGMVAAAAADHGAARCSSPPRPGCSTSCARPTRSCCSSRSTGPRCAST